MTDPTQLDPSVEAFIARQEKARYKAPPAETSISIHGTPLYATTNDLGEYGGTLKLWFGPTQHVTAFMPYPIARDLSDAINTVLARHAGEEKPAHERVRDIEINK